MDLATLAGATLPDMAARQRVPEGPAPEPVVQKVRVRYAKRGRMRFTSSRDFQRALERGLRLAGVPMAYSAGFHPHPKISYANAAPTGVASEAEYVELSLRQQTDPETLRARLDASLPEGLHIVAVVPDEPGALADRLEASRWELRFAGLAPADLRTVVEQFLGQQQVLVTRLMKRGPREIDVREPVLAATVRPAQDGGSQGAALELVVRHTTPTVRPAELWTALQEVSGTVLPRPLSTRLAQGPLADGHRVLDPLEPSH